jgi:hypothetical protein
MDRHSAMRLIAFVRDRIEEEADIARKAEPGFAVEATARVTSEDHGAFLRRFGPAWVLAECLSKVTLVQVEVQQAEHLEELDAGPYVFPFTRLLATRWARHPDFDPRWISGTEESDEEPGRV